MKRKLLILASALLSASAILACYGGDSYHRSDSDRTESRDWCATCGGDGVVYYVTTGQSETCGVCHGSGVRD